MPFAIVEWKRTYFWQNSGNYSEPVSSDQAPVVQKMDSTIHRINQHPVDKYRKINCAIQWMETYPMDKVIHLLKNWRDKRIIVTGLLSGECAICTGYLKKCGSLIKQNNDKINKMDGK